MNFPESIEQLWVFGSHARGDYDRNSDVDILMISELDEKDYVTNYFSKKYSSKIDVSHYSYEGLLPVINTGSLFACHLKKEAIPIYQKSKKLSTLLNEMPDYHNHLDDLEVLKVLIEDVRLSLHDRNNTYIFDAGVLGTAIRNTGIILCNYLGNEDYSPWAPLKLGRINPIIGIPISDCEYRFLQKCRRLGERGGVIKERLINTEKLAKITMSIANWQHECMSYIKQKEVS